MGQRRTTKDSPERQAIDSQRLRSPAGAVSNPLLQFQQTIGNRAIGQFLQAKLKVNNPVDIYEREADAVADLVMHKPAPDSDFANIRADLNPAIRRKCADCEEEVHLQRKPPGGPMYALEQRQEDQEESEELVRRQVNALRGSGGHPLPESERNFFEPRFGYDFSQVRIHTDARAAESARTVNTRAYTVGRDVVLGAKEYTLGTAEGRRLLAHELTHVVQQRDSGHLQRKKKPEPKPTKSKKEKAPETTSPSAGALKALEHAQKQSKQTDPVIWFDSWGNDLRDNNLNSKVDEKVEQGLADGVHYGKDYNAMVCKDSSDTAIMREALRLQAPDQTRGNTAGLPGNHNDHSLFRLQQAIGNHAMGRFLQAKLNISQPDDKYEKEADWVAEQVMRVPDTGPSIPTNGLFQPRQAYTLSALPPTVLARKKPDETKAVHNALFVTSPISATCKKWQDKATKASPKTTGEEIVDEFRKNLEEQIKEHPLSVGGEVKAKTTEAEIDTTALRVNQKILKKFGSVIKTSLNDKEVQDRVKILAAEKTEDPEFVKQWLANKLLSSTTISEYCLDESDKRFQKVLDDILADEPTAKNVRILASRQSAFFEGEGSSRSVHIHKGLESVKAESTLIHELIHFYAHPDYRKWNAPMISPRFINEGFTEFLAREIDSSSERSAYKDRFEFIRDKVAKYVSVDDIASAYFAGEVWKVENISKVAKELFGAHEKEKKKAK